MQPRRPLQRFGIFTAVVIAAIIVAAIAVSLVDMHVERKPVEKTLDAKAFFPAQSK